MSLTKWQSLDNSKDAAIALKDAQSTDVVEEVLNSEFFDDAEWRALGQKENNYGIVENQAGAPVPALVELIVNSYDAILMKNFHERVGTSNPDPEEDDLPQYDGQYDAREDLLTNPQDERVELRADGSKPTEDNIINFTLIDNGCGQAPKEFEDTFLGLLDPGKYKQDYPFLQGQYGMGSSGVLQFCGGKSYKFICSAAFSEKSEWSWSIVRQNRERGRYEYVTIDGEVPTFHGAVEGETYGTFVKVYDYELTVGKTVITGDERFQKRLERFLVDPPLDLTLNDSRYPSAKVTETQTPGLLGRIDEHEHLVEERYPTKYDFEHEKLGVRDIEVITFKNNQAIKELREEGDATTRNKGRFIGGPDHQEMAILYTVNGQTHGNEGLSFLTNRCSKPRVGKDTIVWIDFSDIAGTDMVDLFQPTRDRIKRSEIGNTLREGIEDALENDEWLKEEEARRRQQLASEETDEILDESLESLLEEDPDLQRFFETGEKASTEKPSEDKRPYNPPEIPDTFKILETYDAGGNHDFYDAEENGTYEIDVPVNRSRRIRFFLNAPNKYLSETAGGELRVKPDKEPIQFVNLNRGIFTCGIEAPEMYDPGDAITLQLNITRPDRDPLSQKARINFVTEQEKTKSSSSPPDSSGSAGLQLPNIERVREDDWDRYEFDEQDLVYLAVAGDTVSDMDIYVNVDAAPVRRFLDHHDLRESGKEFVEERYVIATALYSMSMYIEYENAYEDDELLDFATPEELVASSMKGLGQVLLHSVAPKQLLSEY